LLVLLITVCAAWPENYPANSSRPMRLELIEFAEFWPPETLPDWLVTHTN